MKTNQQIIRERYDALRAEVLELLVRIEHDVMHHDKDDPDHIDYGHVGSLSHVKDQLTEIDRFLR
jgi:hypothetical protein